MLFSVLCLIVLDIIRSLRSHQQQTQQVASNLQTLQGGFIPAQKTAALLLA